MKYNSYMKGDKIRIIFLFQVPSFWMTWESVYEECIVNKKYEVVVYLLEDEVNEPSQMRGAREFLDKKGIRFEKYNFSKVLDFKPHYIFVQTPYDKGHRYEHAWSSKYRVNGIRVIYIPYGIEISDTLSSRFKHFSISAVINANLIFVMSEEIKKEYDKYCINSGAVRVTGLSRFDTLVNSRRSVLSNQILKKIKGRKVILWKAHFPKIFIVNGVKNQATPKLEEYIRFVKYVEENNDLFFIFMPHPKFCDHTIDALLRKKAITLISKLEILENVYIDRDDDYRKSLVSSDAIIIDRSAVMVEAGIMKVPTLYMSNTLYYEPMVPTVERLINSYYQGTTAEEMIKFVENIKNDVDDKKREREQVVSNEIPYLDGKVYLRILNCMEKEIENDSDNGLPTRITKEDKLILFGMGTCNDLCKEIWKQEKKGEIIAFVDNDFKKWGQKIEEVEISPPKKILELKYNYIVISTDAYYSEIYHQLTDEMMISSYKIISAEQFVSLLKQKKVKYRGV